jgi:hypothetical protein
VPSCQASNPLVGATPHIYKPAQREREPWLSVAVVTAASLPAGAVAVRIGFQRPPLRLAFPDRNAAPPHLRQSCVDPKQERRGHVAARLWSHSYIGPIVRTLHQIRTLRGNLGQHCHMPLPIAREIRRNGLSHRQPCNAVGLIAV